MPVGMAVDILEHADISVFVGQGGAVECERGDLKSPDCLVYFLKDHLCQTMVVRDVWDKVHCKTLGLPLNFHQEMVRYQFRTPPKENLSRDEWLTKCNRYIRLWIDFIVAEKKRQMNMPSEMWPWMPWKPQSVWSMPIVLWRSTPGKRDRPLRTAIPVM